MRYKRVGKIDFDFSELGYGCWGASGMPSWGGHTDQLQIEAILFAIDNGINMFDVAPVYGLGHAEIVLGKAMKGNRDKIFVATKCGLPWDENMNVRNDVREAVILKEMDESLERLGTDYVDLYQVHWPTADGVAIEETMSALGKILQSGKARYVGLSNFSVEDANQAQKYVEISSMQGLYNMVERNAESYHGIPLPYRVEKEVLPFTRENQMAFLPYSPLFQGLLSGSFTSSQKYDAGDVRNSNPKLVGDAYAKHFALIEKLKKFSAELGRPLNEVAINYLASNDAVTSIIAGARNSNQVKANLKAMEWKLDESAIKELESIVDGYKF